MVDFIKQSIPDLKQTGVDFTACCPFHDEKSPSFKVVTRKNFYHCFGCGAHGNVINFEMQFNQVNFVDAVKSLACRVGMEIPKLDQPEKNAEEKDAAVRFMRTCDATKTAQEIYSVKLDQHQDAKDYLATRGVKAETIEAFGIGFAPEAWDTISKNRSIKPKTAEWAGLTIKKPATNHVYDRFRNRIMFPIYGSKDYIIGFGGRSIGDQTPKYLNSPEGEFFKKGENLYGLKQALLSKKVASRVFVVEGYMDNIMLAQEGVDNVVATLGTAVTDVQIKKLLRISTHITFCLDGDKPGRAAAKRVAEMVLPFVNEFQKIDLMLLPDDMDPDDFIRKRGYDDFMQEAGNAKGATDFLIDVIKEQEDTSQSAGMVRYLATISDWAAKIESAPMKLAFNKYAAEKAGISLDALLGMLNKPEATVLTPVAKEGTTVVVADNKAISISVAARMLGITIVREPALLQKIEVEALIPFLTLSDKEMLFPLMVYVKTNPEASKDAIAESLAYNPHIYVIKEIVLASKLLSDSFDANAEAKTIIEGFRRMSRVWQITNSVNVIQ